MSVFDRLFGKSKDGERLARRAEAASDLAGAVTHWLDAGRPDEAARVLVMRGDAELDGARRLQHYVQAIATAPTTAPIRGVARRKRALLALEMSRAGATSAAARRDLLDAATELEALGDAVLAAEAYALAGDMDGEARSLIDAGDVEKLEDVLERDRLRAHAETRRQAAAAEVDHLVRIGRRREALARAEAAGLEEHERALASRRAVAPRITIELRGRRLNLVLGEVVTLGRSEADVVVASHAASRRHLAIARAGDRVEVRDLGSRNGTELRGMRMAGALVVPMQEGSGGLDLRIGGEVPLRVGPSHSIAGAVAIDVGGVSYVAPLGSAKLGVGAWLLDAGPDGWVELVSGAESKAYLGRTELGARTALLLGDAASGARGAPAVLRIVG